MVLAKSAESVGKDLLLPTSWSGGGSNWISLPPVAAAPAQLRIHTVSVSPQALFDCNQQLWPPATLATMRDWSGSVRFTTELAASYARFTSSLRANSGACPPA